MPVFPVVAASVPEGSEDGGRESEQAAREAARPTNRIVQTVLVIDGTVLLMKS